MNETTMEMTFIKQLASLVIATIAVALYRGCGEARTSSSAGQVIPSQAIAGQSPTGAMEGVETSGLSPDNNDRHECPAPRSCEDEEIVRTSDERRSATQTVAIRSPSEYICGNLALTNLQMAGQLASDQTYVILALRCWMFFDGTNRRANYLNVASQLFWTLIVGNKPMFQAPYTANNNVRHYQCGLAA